MRIAEIEDAVLALKPAKRSDDEAVALSVKRAGRIFFDREWGKRPIISTLVHRLG